MKIRSISLPILTLAAVAGTSLVLVSSARLCAQTNTADSTMTAPGQSTTFSTLSPSNPVISGSNVAFTGFFGTGGSPYSSSGIYTGVVGTTGATRIVDSTMTASGQSTSYSGFGDSALSGNNVVFASGYSSTSSGIYSGVAGTTGATRIVDSSMTAPNQSTTFSVFGDPSISGNKVAFQSTYNSGNSSGIYTGVAGTTGATRIADTSMTAPGQSTPFSQFVYNAAISGSNVAFQGFYNSNGGQGIYTGVAGTTGATRITDTSMTAPGQSTTFSSFASYPAVPAISGSNIAFQGSYNSGSGQGIYSGVAGTTGATRIVDTSMTAPGQSTAFTAFGNPVIGGTTIVFRGTFNSGNGTGLYSAVTGTAGATRIADSSMTAPGQSTKFSLFSTASISGGNIAFFGYFNSNNGVGVFVFQGGKLFAIAETGQSLFGSTVSNLSFTGSGLDGNNVTFNYTLANGVSGVATFAVPEPSTWIAGLGGVGLLGFALRRQRRHT